MVAISEPAKAQGFSFRKAISVGLGSVFRQPSRFLKLALFPFLLGAVLSLAKIPAAMAVPGSDLAFIFLDLIPYTLLAIGMGRMILLEEDVQFLPRPLLARRTWVYFGYSLLMMMATILAVVILAAAGALAGSLINRALAPFDVTPAVVTVAVGIGLLLAYAMARLSLVFPAVTVDERLGLRGSWRLARGSGLKLLGLFLVMIVMMLAIAAIGSMILGSDLSLSLGSAPDIIPGATLEQALAANAGPLIWGSLTSLLASAVYIAAFTSAFKQLSGWDAPRQDILERFE